MKRLLSFAFILAFLTTTSSVLVANAGDPSICGNNETFFEKITGAFNELNMRKSAVNFLSSTATDGLIYATTQGTTNEIVSCASTINELNLKPELQCAPKDPSYCDSFFQTYPNQQQSSGLLGSKFAHSRVSGSLLGIAYTMQDATNEPIPVNLAYYWNDHVGKIPLIGKTALAAPVSYNGPLLDTVYGVWELMRNIAYGILAIIMLVSGLMIIFRKKINQQAVVSFQYAFPKIVLAIILITFSYPIGATLASLGWTLRWSAEPIIRGIADFDPSVWAVFDKGMGGIITALLILGIIPGVGLVLLVIVAIIIGVILLSMLYFWIQLLLVYVKLVVKVVTSPITFAMGAIPGNDSAITGWFKQVASYLVSLPVMVATSTLIQLVGIRLLIDALGGQTSSWAVGLSGVLGIIVIPFLIIFGNFYAAGIPAKVDAAIVGETKKPKR